VKRKPRPLIFGEVLVDRFPDGREVLGGAPFNVAWNLRGLGFDPLWFGVLFTINMEMAYITPPFGFNLFILRGVAPPEVTMTDIYRSVGPFVLLQALCLVLVMIWPELALWLPSLMKQ